MATVSFEERLEAKYRERLERLEARIAQDHDLIRGAAWACPVGEAGGASAARVGRR
ncbi:MAG: hypothetical protein M3P18_11175 [Actinomycetota bacterium]|nr:hypothetical protein [Actinomycetota bacterium]